MAKTLLQGVNEVLKKVQILSETNLLSSLTNSGKQVFIDNAIQAWNEGVDQLYSKANILKPYQGAEGTLTLVTDQRTYTLATDLVQLRGPFHNEDDGWFIEEYPGGFEELKHIQSFPDNFTGRPQFYALSPQANQVYFDRLPTSAENGEIYKYQYGKETVLEAATDTFPFEDAVFRAMVPSVADMWRLFQQNGDNTGAFKISFGRAIRLVKRSPANRTYVRRRFRIQSGPLGFDPFN